MAYSSKKRRRPGVALAVFVGLVALILGGIVANAELRDGRYLPQLGLDLAGGTTVTLTAVTEAGKQPPQDQMNQAVRIIRQRVNGLGIAEAQVTAQGDSIIVQVPGQSQREVVEQVGQTAKLYFRQVLVAAPAGKGSSPAPSPSAARSGTPEPTSDRKSGGERGSAQPTGTPSGRALAPALTGPDTDDRGHAAAAPTGLPTSRPTSLPTGLGQQQQRPDLSGVKPAKLKEFVELDCDDTRNRAGGVERADEQVVVCNRKGTQKFILGPAKVLGTEVQDARAVSDPRQFGQWKVTLEFSGKGAEQFGQLTTKADKAQGDRNRIAIELDRRVMSAPSIDEGPVRGGTAEISGDFTQSQANDLANVLRYGALPLEFEQSSIESVSPTLGRELLTGGLVAGFVGLIVVGCYVLLYYRGLGLISIASLAGSATLTFGVVTLMSEFIGYRLTLAGIGGLIVAIGITADSFIVYFERLRDEVREGRSLRQATERSWVRARRTILTADTVTFMAALILYVVSVDQVRGFAFTLGLTTLIDVVVVFGFTKPVISLLMRTRFFGAGHRLSGLSAATLGVTGRTSRSARGAAAGET